MFNLKSMALKISLVIFLLIIAVTGVSTLYMETRIIAEVEGRSAMDMKRPLLSAKEVCDTTFNDAVYNVAGIRRFVEGFFDVERYKSEPAAYFENALRPALNGFIRSCVADSNFISGAFFTVDPDLAGRPVMKEVYYAKGAGGVEVGESQTYEEFKVVDAEDMQWYYGAYNSGRPFWTRVHMWVAGDILVSYAEPVIVGGAKVGVVGADIQIGHIEALVHDIAYMKTGFALIQDRYDEFFMSNSFISELPPVDRASLTGAGRSSGGEAFDASFNGVGYKCEFVELINGYGIYIMTPQNEYYAGVWASVAKYLALFISAAGLMAALSYAIGKAFVKPLVVLSGYLVKAGATGDFTFDRGEEAAARKYAGRRDEIGHSLRSARAFSERFTRVGETIQTFARGDLTSEISVLSEGDVIGCSLQYMIARLNKMFSEIRTVANCVADGAGQIAEVSRLLAQGAAEQASTVEQLSASIADMAQKTKGSAETAGKAAKLTHGIKSNAQLGGAQMAELQSAIKEISEASGNIGKIINTIDDIAFQTNILALNAAVEAARAGAHGKGFAVVAEEVRNLAAKSATAANETGLLIKNSMDKVALGVRITDGTAENFSAIVTGVGESNLLIEDMASSANEQTAGASQIDLGINQVAVVIQQNSATAEEAAAASHDMSEQSELLMKLITQFHLKG